MRERLRGLRLTTLGLAATILLAAAPPPQSPPPPGAASCSGCHGGVAPLPVLAGQPAETITTALAAFRSGDRHGTIMGRIAKGFTEAETAAIAAWWAAQP
ncbi:MAG: cytochrome c [Acetobacteraceae bacterium]